MQFEQERKGNLDLQFSQIPECNGEVRVRFFPQRHTTIMPGKGMNILDERIQPCLCHRGFTGIVLERGIDVAQVRNLASSHGQVMPYEGVKVRAITILGKADLHRVPVILIDLALLVWLQPHQNEIADQVRLAQFTACRVHTLENKLRVMLIAGQ
jgi:hypothetical protein